MAQILMLADLKNREQLQDDLYQRRLIVRDNLYYNYRYRAGSYKARKAMIHPFLMVAKRADSVLRLYDDGSHQPTKHQEQAMKAKCQGWRKKERELRRQAKIAKNSSMSEVGRGS